MNINDTFLLQSLIPKLLKEVIDSPMVYCNVVRVFEDIKLRTEVGQMLDLSTVAVDTHSLNYKYPCAAGLNPRYFTDDYYREIIVNKTAYYTVFLPVYLGLVLAQCDSSLLRSELLQEWCVLLGCYFQVRDDYLDVFADASVLKKEGTDIQEGKCSWVVLTVLSLGTRVALAYALAGPVGESGIWWAIPIGWFLADAVGLGYYFRHRRTLLPDRRSEE